MPMYQPHDIRWFLLSFVICLVLLGVAVLLRERSKWRLPKWTVPALVAVTALQLVLAGGTRAYDDGGYRDELRGLDPGKIKRLGLSQGGMTREITDPSQVSDLFSQIQTLKSIGAHSSHPTREFDLVFEYDGHRYHYRVGRDSARPDEYWVLEMNRPGSGYTGREIGRVKSDQLGRAAENLLGARP
jgi:hypothetical protein